MAEHPEVKKRRSLKQILRGGLYNAVFQPGLSRWVLLAVAAFVFMLSALYLTGGTDFREDPSALVPRSAEVYLETRDLGTLLKNVAAWKVWRPEHRATGQEVHNTDLEKEVANAISRFVPGLPTSQPLGWMNNSKGAAWCVSSNDGAAKPSWGLYLRLDDVSAALNDAQIEQGMKLELIKGTRDNGVFVLTGQGGGRLCIGVVNPWIILSADEKLAEFALDAKRRPSQSLAGAGLVPKWKRGYSLRGIASPAASSALTERLGASFVANWFAPEARMAFTAKSGRSGEVETSFSVVSMNDRIGGGGFWPLFFVVMLVLALVSLALIFAVLLAMLGWGGWLKLAAAKAGIAPAGKPVQVSPSAAFQQDSGMAAAKAKKDASELSEPTVATVSATVNEDDTTSLSREAHTNEAQYSGRQEVPVTAEVVESDPVLVDEQQEGDAEEQAKSEFGINPDSGTVAESDDAVSGSDTNEGKRE